MQELANFIVVALVVVAGLALLFMLASQNQSAPSQNKPAADYVSQILALWIYAWLMWLCLWGVKGFVKFDEFTPGTVKGAQLLVDLHKTNNTYSVYLWRKLAGKADQLSEADLVRRLNIIVRSGPLFDGEHINSACLTATTVTNLGRIFDGATLIAFNCQVLQDLFKDDFQPRVNRDIYQLQKYLKLAFSSLNAIFLLLIVIVVQAQKRMAPVLVFFYGLITGTIILAYYVAMYFLSQLDASGNEAFERLVLNWSIAESIIAPLLLTVSVWKAFGTKWPLVFGLLYAFAQPIVYHADVDSSSGLSSESKEAILITLAFLKIFLAASVLYAIGRYAPLHGETPFRCENVLVLKKKVSFSRWNVAVGVLVLLGVTSWYFMAGKAYPGLVKAGGTLIAVVTTAYKLLKGEET